MTKKHTPAAFLLTNIELVNTGMDIPGNFKSGNDYRFRVELESRVNEEKQTIIVSNRIDITKGDDPILLAWLVTNYWFEVADYKEVIKKDNNGVCQIPVDLQLSVNAIALSTTRGLLFSAFRGTQLHNAILPVIDPANFTGSE